jgi:hypothetical protein
LCLRVGGSGSSSGLPQPYQPFVLPVLDGGVLTCPAGPSPPMPGWDCVPIGPMPTRQWCCAQ